MPVSVVPSSAKQAASKRLKSATARKRRQNQNGEIDELASLVPLAQMSLVPSDKLSVLRLATTFLKLQSFMKDTSLVNGSNNESVSTNDFAGLLKEAIDGFLIVLDKEANILYVSESIDDYVGLSQQDVIGQNLVDITHAESGAEIAACLKPSMVPVVAKSNTMEGESSVSQFRQFYVKFKPTPKSTSYPVVQVKGNLKVKLPPLRRDVKAPVRVAEPEVMGFTGECRVIESLSSIVEISVSHSTFTMLKNSEKQITYIEASVKEIVGYDPEEVIVSHDRFIDFLHPAEVSDMKAKGEDIKMEDSGHSVSPYFRFLTKSGDWVWMQMEGITHYKKGTTIPEYYEYKARVLSQGTNKMRRIEHKAETDDDGKQSPPPDHQQQSNVSSTSTPSPLSSSSTTSSDYQLPTISQGSTVSCGSPSVYSSTRSVSSLSTTSPGPPLSVSPAAPTSSPAYLPPQPQSQSSNRSPETGTSLHTSVSTDSIPLATSALASVPFQNSPQTSGTEVPNGVQSPPDAGIQSSPFVQNRVQSPPSVSGSIFSTASTDSGMILPAQRNFSSSGGSLSPDSCSPYNSPISTVSTLPPSSAWSPETGTSLHTSASTDSIPSVTSGSVPFQNSPQSSDFVPSAPPPAPVSTTFSSQIPSDFNFSTFHSQNFDNYSDFAPGLDFTMLEPQQFSSSSIPQVHPEDSVLQHLLDEMITLNGDSGFSGATIPGNGTVNMDNSFILDSMPNSNSNSSASFQAKSSRRPLPSPTCFNPEVQDIFHQFS